LSVIKAFEVSGSFTVDAVEVDYEFEVVESGCG
jgi:hypothetical protein